MNPENFTKFESTFEKIKELAEKNQEVPDELKREFLNAAKSYEKSENLVEVFCQIFGDPDDGSSDEDDESRGMRTKAVKFSLFFEAFKFFKFSTRFERITTYDSLPSDDESKESQDKYQKPESSRNATNKEDAKDVEEDVKTKIQQK